MQWKDAEMCVNVHLGYEVLKLFINGVGPTIWSLVARHRKSHPRATYLEIVQYDRAEADTVRARSQMAKMYAHNPSRFIPVNLIRSSSDSAFLTYDGYVEPLLNNSTLFREQNGKETLNLRWYAPSATLLTYWPSKIANNALHRLPR